MTTQAYTGTSRDEYFAWIADWKSEYKTLSQKIRTLKAQRKPYRYEYRDPKDNTSQRRVKIGDNPNYQPGGEYTLMMLSYEAHQMMILREQAKATARASYEAEQRALAA